MTYFDEPPQFGRQNGGGLAIHSRESHARMSASVSTTELHMAGHIVAPGEPTRFQYVRLYALAPRTIGPGRYVIGPEMQVALDNGTTCYARSGEVVIHELLHSAGVIATAAVSIRASYAGAPSYSLCQGEVFAELRRHSAVPVLAAEHAGTTDLGRIRVGTATPPQTWSITNDGTTPLHLRTLVTSGPHSPDVKILNDGCARLQLAPGATCTVEFTVTPGAAGARRAFLEIAGNCSGPAAMDSRRQLRGSRVGR